jgi:ribulose-5-phosphate 4-epimerase/fuculose-1-phosphate aldolase
VGDAGVRAQLVELAAALYDRGLTPGRTGNLSAAGADGVLVTPTGACLGRLDPGRLSLVDPAGRHLDGDPPTKELSLHLALHARGARAVAHVHSPYAVALSCLTGLDPDAPLPPYTAYFAMRVGRMPLLPYAAPGDPALADAVAALPPGVRCALLAHHGSIAAAATAEAAVDAVEEIEATAHVALLLHGRDAWALPAAEATRLAQ